MDARRLARIALTVVILSGLVVAALGPQRVVKTALWHLRRGWLILSRRLVDVGGYHLRIEREGNGSPTVVMDAGLCQIMSSWGRVPFEVAKFTRVVIYDRAGLGQSDVGPTPRTSQQNVVELHSLLVNAGITGPYVFVGHSFGGLNIRLYASEYPAEVAGVVLVDASHEEQYLRFAALKPPEEREVYLRHEGGANCERVDLLASGREVHAAPSLPPVPLAVLSADPYDQEGSANGSGAKAQMEMQSNLAHLVPNSRHIVVRKSGHFIQRDQPGVVIDAIRTVVESARKQSHMQSQLVK